MGVQKAHERSFRVGFRTGARGGYLSLDRSTPTLSPGELQRLRLATQIRPNLLGVVYVLDEEVGVDLEAAVPGIISGHITGGMEFIKRLVDVDQKPIGRTPRSNLATYMQRTLTS